LPVWALLDVQVMQPVSQEIGIVRATMTKDDKNQKNNVVHLGTGDMAAIGKALRDLYEVYLYSEPPERLQRLVAMIGQAGEGDGTIPPQPRQEADQPADAGQPETTRP
jgi:hypothetical protein